MRTIEVNVYKFSELSEKAQENAIQRLCEINVDFEWWESTYEDAKNIGLKITEFELDRYRYAKGHFLLSACEVAQNILNDHGEGCETYKTAQKFMDEWQPVFNNYMDETHEDYESRESEEKLMDMENDFLSYLLDDYSIILRDEYEYLTSEQAIIETIEANEYEFTEDGEMY